jgi:predicted DNA-binding protein (UPF0278 family)
LELSRNQIWEDEIKPWFSLKINGVEHHIYNYKAVSKITSYMNISIKNKEMGLVVKGEDVKDHVSNKENVTEIKWDPFGDNISVPYEDFYEFINKKLQVTNLFRKIAFLNDMANKTTFAISFNKSKLANEQDDEDEYEDDEDDEEEN